MTTIGWLFILAAAVILRQVAKGRVVELPQDARDMLVGALRGDFEAVKEAAARSGEGLTPSLAAEGSSTISGTAGGGAASSSGAAVIAEMKRLGDGKRYIWSGTFAPGSGGGDCSGLVWRALHNLGIYKGPRFTTFTFPVQSRGFATRVSDPQPGDIVVWNRGLTGHMGIVTGPNRFYSALSSEAGVREAQMSAIRGAISYYRLK